MRWNESNIMSVLRAEPDRTTGSWNKCVYSGRYEKVAANDFWSYYGWKTVVNI